APLVRWSTHFALEHGSTRGQDDRAKVGVPARSAGGQQDLPSPVEVVERGAPLCVPPLQRSAADLSRGAPGFLVLELRQLLARIRQPPKKPGIRRRKAPRDARGGFQVEDRFLERFLLLGT